MSTENFKQRTNVVYPPNNHQIFEDYFLDNFNSERIKNDYIYLDILWTSYYISRNYGTGDISDLQNYLDSLDRSKKYFTIVQYDDCILNDLKDLDIFIFSQGGPGKMTRDLYPIPLNCLGNEANNSERERKILGSFLGSISGRHHLREKMSFFLRDKSGFLIEESNPNQRLSDYSRFKDLLETSTFSLCPRGYGATSFRICEALQHGSIPVYIYDIPWTPFPDRLDFEKIGILISEIEIENLESILRSKSESEIEEYRENGRKYYSKYFSYKGCFESILEKVNSL